MQSVQQPYRVVFAGTPAFAVPSLQALLALPQHFDVRAVYSQPDRRAGRGRQLTASPVKQCAQVHSIPVIQVENFRTDEARAQLAALQPDFLVVVAYGLILPQAVLDIPRIACINVHASLLPRWRGAAPIQRALIAGDEQTGVAIMDMVKALDAGGVYAEAVTSIESGDTGASLPARLAELGATLLVETLPKIAEGTVSAVAQDESLVCYADKLTKTEALIHWQEPAELIERKIRAYQPWPIAYTEWKDQRIRVWQAAVQTTAEHLESQADGVGQAGCIVHVDRLGIIVQTGEGLLRLETLQLPGSKPMAVADLLNARPTLFGVGERFSLPGIRGC